MFLCVCLFCLQVVITEQAMTVQRRTHRCFLHHHFAVMLNKTIDLAKKFHGWLLLGSDLLMISLLYYQLYLIWCEGGGCSMFAGVICLEESVSVFVPGWAVGWLVGWLGCCESLDGWPM